MLFNSNFTDVCGLVQYSICVALHKSKDLFKQKQEKPFLCMLWHFYLNKIYLYLWHGQAKNCNFKYFMQYFAQNQQLINCMKMWPSSRFRLVMLMMTLVCYGKNCRLSTAPTHMRAPFMDCTAKLFLWIT